ncbi:helix-turn-helix transcriptional regulator [Eggerthellaceae bacterium zg-1084]|uniref:helix-turn-helix transcriptional regulator n=1 Tax=Berryella wangjianweii TaxID=2734634 RepID=UPI0015545BBB|nr:helix-turn-helix transcriptional regulator [Berryella wangjianweii]NPD30732.1 helix-turn-helix transcriptional regulator [Berryella wangjianweii]
MEQLAVALKRLSPRRIAGFACNQAFIYFLLYMGFNRSVTVAGVELERVELLATLLAMVALLALYRRQPPRARAVVCSLPILYVCAALMALTSLCSTLLDWGAAPWAIAEGALVGGPAAVLLMAWGLTFGSQRTDVAVPEVFAGSLLAALVCLLFTATQGALWFTVAFALLPFASVVNIDLPRADASAEAGEASEGAGQMEARMEARGAGAARVGSAAASACGVLVPASAGAATGEADRDVRAPASAHSAATRPLPAMSAAAVAVAPGSAEGDRQMLSLKVMAGTACFGAAAGLMETFGTDPGGATTPAYAASILVFAGFLTGALSLLLSRGRTGAAALGACYRMAVFVIMVGVLVVGWPAAEASPTPGKVYVLAGYLGLETVLLSLFLVLAGILSTRADLTFARGLSVLLMGEVAGVVAGNVSDAAALAFAGADPAAFPGPLAATELASFATSLIAGVLVLAAYVFLFTERDFISLAAIARRDDSLELRDAELARRYGLSPREAQIVRFVLRGRTSERIAQELSVSRSTVDTHLRRVYAKAQVHSRQELLDVAEDIGRRLDAEKGAASR